jgi:hypothetical protein
LAAGGMPPDFHDETKSDAIARSRSRRAFESGQARPSGVSPGAATPGFDAELRAKKDWVTEKSLAGRLGIVHSLAKV